MFGSRLKKARKDANLTLDELSAKYNSRFCGRISKGTLSKYENGRQEPMITVVRNLSLILGVSVDYLLGNSEKTDYQKFISPKATNDTTTYHILGDIAAGYNITAQENWEGEEIEIPNSYIKGSKEDYFVLRVKGDSMYPDYQNGDCVLIHKQSSLDHSGQIGAVLFDGEYATLKRVEYKQGEDWMKLIPINTLYPPKTIRNEELEQCFVLGVPKVLIRNIF